MRIVAFVLAVSLTPLALGQILEIPLDTLDPAGYFTVQEGMDCWVETEDPLTFIRTNGLSESTGWPGSPWYYAPIIDFETYTGGTVDASAEGATLEFDVRYYQEGIGDDGSDPYQNCSFGVALYSYIGPNWWNYDEQWWPGAFSNPEPHGEWHHMVFDLADTLENEDFDLTTLGRVEIHGSNGRHVWEDHIDLSNLVITPEPATLGLFAIGLLGLMRRR